MRRLEDTSFAVLILTVSLAFAWIVQPLFGAILWGVIASILFAPLNDRLLRTLPRRNNLAALLTLLVIMAMVILPAILLSAFLLQEVAGVYARMQSGEVDPGAYFLQLQGHLPHWLKSLLAGVGLSDFEAVRTKLTAGIAASFQTLTARAFNIGQSAFGFVVALGVMLYLTFFLLRDGKQVAARVETAIPLDPDQRAALLAKFTAVIRATIKGSLVVAVIQGAIGGIVFWALGIHSALLWGVLMACLSLLPAIGTGIVWAILVGRDARMPDYVVLISTLGGLEVLGFNGLVIGPVTAALFIAVWDIFARSRLQPEPDAS